MVELLGSILLIIFEVICCKNFFESFAKIRHHGWINILQLVLLSVCVCLLGFELINCFSIKQVLMIVVIALFMHWHVRISIPKSFILAMLYMGILLAVDYFAFVINSEFFSVDIKGENTTGSMLVILFGKSILFLCVLLVQKQFGNQLTDMMVDSEWLKFLFFPVFSIGIIAAMLSTFQYVETTKQANVLFVIAFGVVGMDVIVFYLINDIMKREMLIHENKIFQLQVKNQTAMYRSISENFDKQKKKTHEYKNQMMCIESLLSRKQYEELEQYVQEIYGRLNKELDAINTNNVIVNAVLNTKYQEFVEKKILFVFRVNDLSNLKIGDEDIVIILANLLNNATEACEKCIGKRIIKLKFVKENDNIVIAVKNSYEHAQEFKNGERRTTKTVDAEEHGIGIKNVIHVVEKYGGSYIIQDDNNEFFFSIVIPD